MGVFQRNFTAQTVFFLQQEIELLLLDVGQLDASSQPRVQATLPAQSGRRSFEVFHLPGHSDGSIALYERATETLFAGDVIYDGELAYDADNAAEMQQYVTSMKRLLGLPVKIVHGGHYPSFGQDRMRVIIQDFLGEFDR